MKNERGEKMPQNMATNNKINVNSIKIALKDKWTEITDPDPETFSWMMNEKLKWERGKNHTQNAEIHNWRHMHIQSIELN